MPGISFIPGPGDSGQSAFDRAVKSLGNVALLGQQIQQNAVELKGRQLNNQMLTSQLQSLALEQQRQQFLLDQEGLNAPVNRQILKANADTAESQANRASVEANYAEPRAEAELSTAETHEKLFNSQIQTERDRSTLLSEQLIDLKQDRQNKVDASRLWAEFSLAQDPVAQQLIREDPKKKDYFVNLKTPEYVEKITRMQQVNEELKIRNLEAQNHAKALEGHMSDASDKLVQSLIGAASRGSEGAKTALGALKGFLGDTPQGAVAGAVSESETQTKEVQAFMQAYTPDATPEVKAGLYATFSKNKAKIEDRLDMTTGEFKNNVKAFAAEADKLAAKFGTKAPQPAGESPTQGGTLIGNSRGDRIKFGKTVYDIHEDGGMKLPVAVTQEQFDALPKGTKFWDEKKNRPFTK